MDKFQNKYRIGSKRLQNWDYSSPGSYFITICTKNREHYFGQISNQKMVLNHLGNFAHLFWSEIPIHFPNIRLGDFVVMPNHIHGILIIESVGFVETLHATSLQNQQFEQTEQNKIKNEQMSKISPKSGSISTAIRSYKSVVTKNIREINSEFQWQWQWRFYDHLIKDSVSFHFISEYIIKNPENWKDDTFNN